MFWINRKARIPVFVLLCLISLTVIFPIYFILSTTFKLPKDVLDIKWFPFIGFDPVFENWRTEIGHRWPELSHGLRNSLIISISTSALTLLIGSMAGYGLARFKFHVWKNKDIVVFFLSQRVLPPVVLVIPILLMFRFLKIVDNPLSLIIVNTTFNIPFVVLITRDIFREIPVELDEAARVDGCSYFTLFWKIALPLASAGLVASAILVFTFTWNEYMFALTLAYRKAAPITIQIAGTGNVQGIQFWITSVRGLVAVIPPVVIALFTQRFLVRGLTFGAVKG
ncbi:MAG: carbohydrate ABC transporter permease [Desulfobaccales bacterium]